MRLSRERPRRASRDARACKSARYQSKRARPSLINARVTEILSFKGLELETAGWYTKRRDVGTVRRTDGWIN